MLDGSAGDLVMLLMVLALASRCALVIRCVMSCTFVISGEDAHPKALIGLQAGLSLDVQARDAETAARGQSHIYSAAAVRGEQQGAVFAAIDGNGEVFFHGEGLSMKEGVEPMEQQGA